MSITLFIYIFICGYFFTKQRDFIYFPTTEINHTFKQETFQNAEEHIKTTIVNEEKAHAIIYFGGNGENVDYNALTFSKIFPNYTIYLVKYRGYSGSSGKPSEQGLYSDALNIYDTLKTKYKSISIIGRSLGSGVATYIASQREINKLTLITPFDSIENIADAQFPFLPISLILLDKYDSLSRVNQIKAPTLIFVASDDKIIPVQNTQNLIDAFPSSQRTVTTIEDTNHNSISNNKQYAQALFDFFKM